MKKAILICLSVIMLCSVLSVFVSAAPMTGDLNNDGNVSDQDAIYLLYNTFFPELYPVYQPCDFNKDGIVSDQDAVYLLYYTFFPDLYPLNPVKPYVPGEHETDPVIR